MGSLTLRSHACCVLGICSRSLIAVLSKFTPVGVELSLTVTYPEPSRKSWTVESRLVPVTGRHSYMRTMFTTQTSPIKGSFVGTSSFAYGCSCPSRFLLISYCRLLNTFSLGHLQRCRQSPEAIILVLVTQRFTA